MSETIFDLSMHGIDEAPGKSLIVNRVRYLIHDLADEGGETFIFPLENQKSGLVMFLAKIFKFSPTSPEFEKRKRTAYNGFILSLIGIPTIHEEQYEIAGGLMKFQLHQEGGMFMGAGYMRQETPMPRTQRSHYDLVEGATTLLKEEKREAAIVLLEEVLRLNPEHSIALFMLGEIYLISGHPERVRDIVDRALTVEPNDVRVYHLAARSHITLRQPQHALEILDSALRRYWWEWESWDLKREVATRFALTDVLKAMAEEGQKRLDSDGHLGANEQMRETVVSDFRLRMKLTRSFYEEIDRAADLTRALDLVLKVLSVDDSQKRVQLQFANGQEALWLGTKWRAFWLGRVIAFLTNSFFLFEPTAAMAVYGDMETALKTMQSRSSENYYLKGLSAIFRGERNKVLPFFRDAANLDSKDAFVQFGLLLGLVIDGNSPEETSEVMKNLQNAYEDHPITALARRLFF